MAETLTQRIAGWFRIGRVPEEVRVQMAQEGGILYKAHGIRQTAIYSGFSAPGQYSAARVQGFIGYVAMSAQRFVVRAGRYNKIDVNITFGDPKFSDIIWMATPKYLSLAFDAANHIPNASGNIEVRLHVPDVEAVVRLLAAKGVKVQMR
jgi:hypothetical protein